MAQAYSYSALFVAACFVASGLILVAADRDRSPRTHSLTVILEPATEACFHQYYFSGEAVVVEYSVISASFQDPVIGFQLFDTFNRPVISEFQKRSSNSQFKAAEAGSYKVCFDNTDTRYSKKVVSLRMTSKDEAGTNWETYNTTNLAAEGEYGMKVSEIEGRIDGVRIHVNTIQEIQELHRKVELRDRKLAENNFDRVNRYSAACLLCTITVMLLQVYSLRSLFEDKSALQRFFKKQRK